MVVLPPPSQQQLLKDMDKLRVKQCEDDWTGRILFQCLPVHHDAIKNKNLSLPPFLSNSSTSATVLAASN
jgi:hypothetical protein